LKEGMEFPQFRLSHLVDEGLDFLPIPVNCFTENNATFIDL